MSEQRTFRKDNWIELRPKGLGSRRSRYRRYRHTSYTKKLLLLTRRDNGVLVGSLRDEWSGRIVNAGFEVIWV